MGFEFPVPGDPVKLHGLIEQEGGEPFWRAECMACGYRSTGAATPSAARQLAVRHAAGLGHRCRAGGRPR